MCKVYKFFQRDNWTFTEKMVDVYSVVLVQGSVTLSVPMGERKRAKNENAKPSNTEIIRV